MLEVRKITAEEVKDADKVGTIAFNGRHDFTKEEAPDPFTEPPHWTWGAFENGRLVSKMTGIPYTMKFDGRDAGMRGIGGVATLPEARQGGKVKSIFGALLPDAYMSGDVFSTLAPFSHAFYRMFGYELCCVYNEARIPVRLLVKYKARGSYSQIFPGDDTSDLQKVHSAYIAGINHAIRRDAWPDNIMWRLFTRRDPYNTGVFIYIWRDDAGEPRSYIKYREKRADGGSEIGVEEIMFKDREALYAILAFAGRLSANYNEFVWSVPSFLDPSDLTDIAWDVKQRVVTRDMTRIVNVKKALELMRAPGSGAAGEDFVPGAADQAGGCLSSGGAIGVAGSRDASGAASGVGNLPVTEGSYVVETDDKIIPENNGKWLVEFGQGESRVTHTQKSADISCELPALSQLITGYRSLDSLAASSRLRADVHGNERILRGVFTRRPQHVTEYF